MAESEMTQIGFVAPHTIKDQLVASRNGFAISANARAGLARVNAEVEEKET